MKFIHLADLHLGKMIHAYNLIELQKEALQQIIKYIEKNSIDIVIIAGDIYDRSVPSQEAVNVLNDFLSTLIQQLRVKVMMISGNHDSADRLHFASDILESQGLYIETYLKKEIRYIEVENTRYYLLPFVKPSAIKQLFDEAPVDNYHEAIAYYLSQQKFDTHYQNIFVTHQFVGHYSQVSDSELTISIGGTEVIDPSIFKNFDYVALGHLHAPQYISNEHIRYSGSLLKYSFDESHQKKSFVVVDTNDLSYELIDIKVSLDVVILKGYFKEINTLDYYPNKNDLIAVELLDQQIIPHAMDTLRQTYPHILRLTYPQLMSQESLQSKSMIQLEKLSTYDLYDEFYYHMTQRHLNSQEQKIVKELLEEEEA